MYDWLLKYGENQEHEMRSGNEFATEDVARKNAEKFLSNSNACLFGVEHYPNPKIEIVEV